MRIGVGWHALRAAAVEALLVAASTLTVWTATRALVLTDHAMLSGAVGALLALVARRLVRVAERRARPTLAAVGWIGCALLGVWVLRSAFQLLERGAVDHIGFTELPILGIIAAAGLAAAFPARRAPPPQRGAAAGAAMARFLLPFGLVFWLMPRTSGWLLLLFSAGVYLVLREIVDGVATERHGTG